MNTSTSSSSSVRCLFWGLRHVEEVVGLRRRSGGGVLGEFRLRARRRQATLMGSRGLLKGR